MGSVIGNIYSKHACVYIPASTWKYTRALLYHYLLTSSSLLDYFQHTTRYFGLLHRMIWLKCANSEVAAIFFVTLYHIPVSWFLGALDFLFPDHWVACVCYLISVYNVWQLLKLIVYNVWQLLKLSVYNVWQLLNCCLS